MCINEPLQPKILILLPSRMLSSYLKHSWKMSVFMCDKLLQPEAKQGYTELLWSPVPKWTKVKPYYRTAEISQTMFKVLIFRSCSLSPLCIVTVLSYRWQLPVDLVEGSLCLRGLPECPQTWALSSVCRSPAPLSEPQWLIPKVASTLLKPFSSFPRCLLLGVTETELYF